MGGDFGLSANGRAACARGSSKRPKALILRVTLPDFRSASGIDLDVAERVVKLRARKTKKKSSPILYALEVPLSYSILRDKANAKWDREKHVLTVTMRVSPRANVSGNAAALDGEVAESSESGGLVSEIASSEFSNSP